MSSETKAISYSLQSSVEKADGGEFQSEEAALGLKFGVGIERLIPVFTRNFKGNMQCCISILLVYR